MARFRLVVGTFGLLLIAAAASGQTPPVNGRVANSKGGVVGNAEVSLRDLPGPAMPGMRMTPTPPRLTTRSGGDGAFVFEGVPPGRYIVQVDAPGFERWSQEIAVSSDRQTLAVMLETLEIPGAETAAKQDSQGEDRQALLDRIAALEKRVSEIESSTVLSEPETRVRRIEVYVDKQGNEHDQPVPDAKKAVTYQRERVFRRQTINEKIESALEDQKEKSVSVGVSAAVAVQAAVQTKGEPTEADGHTYELASADVIFTAKVAQNTLFFADLVGLTGPSPDPEVGGLTLLNSFTSRLIRQNELNVREAWLRTELFSRKLALSAGRLDLTNYFDRNAAANDEFTQFLSDALVNNQALGLAVNGIGAVGVYDPKNSWQFKAGFQQSNLLVNNLSQSLFSLAEIDYFARPFSLPEGNYRLWGRTDNSSGHYRKALGVSIDQKLTPELTLFARYGFGRVDPGRLHFYSGGLQVQKRFVVNPGDTWALGYGQTNIPSVGSENLAEGYYNFRLSERLRLSLYLTHVIESRVGEKPVGYFVPGLRFQANF